MKKPSKQYEPDSVSTYEGKGHVEPHHLSNQVGDDCQLVHAEDAQVSFMLLLLQSPATRRGNSSFVVDSNCMIPAECFSSYALDM